MSAYRITVSGHLIKLEPKNGTDFDLDELVEAIGGGYIEVVRIGDTHLMVIDEEGKCKELPINPSATFIFQRFNQTGDVIVGDAVLCHTNQIK